jgi:hypothetical protein
MKFLKSPKGAFTFLLIALLIASFFWIVRSEIRAASLQSRLDEHHTQLKNNADILENLGSFVRKINNNGITIDGNKVLIASDQSIIKLEKNNIEIEAKGDITIGPSSQKDLGYDKNEDYIYMRNGESRIVLGEIIDNDKKSLGNGINLISKTGGTSLTVTQDKITLYVPSKDGHYKLWIDPTQQLVGLKQGQSSILIRNDSVLVRAKQDISMGPSSEKDLGYNKNEDYIYMRNGESRIVVGEIFDKDKKSAGNGINLISKTGGTSLTVRQDKIMLYVPSKDGHYKLWIDPTQQLVGLKQGQSEIIMRNDKIDIEALGDINITSKNGKVNINGKR